MSPALAILLSYWVGVSLQVVPNGIGLLASSSAGLPTQRNLVDISIVLLLHLFQMSPEHRRRQLLFLSQDHYLGLPVSGQCPLEELLDIMKVFSLDKVPKCCVSASLCTHTKNLLFLIKLRI